jgi:exonuclease SbcD
MMGLDLEYTSGALLGAQCDAFMLGHIHKQQSWERDGRQLAYPGSIGRLHYGEEDVKGFLLWDVAPGHAEFSVIETPARRMIHLDFAGMPDMAEIEQIRQTAEGAFIRVRWVVDEENRNAVDRDEIAALLGNAAEIKLEPRIIPITRTRAEGMNRTTSAAEKLAVWSKVTATSTEGLEERLVALQAATPEAIAAGILS